METSEKARIARREYMRQYRHSKTGRASQARAQEKYWAKQYDLSQKQIDNSEKGAAK